MKYLVGTLALYFIQRLPVCVLPGFPAVDVPTQDRHCRPAGRMKRDVSGKSHRLFVDRLQDAVRDECIAPVRIGFGKTGT